MGAAGFHLHNVADDGFVGIIFGADEDDWEAFFDEANRTMFGFASGERYAGDVGDFHEF